MCVVPLLLAILGVFLEPWVASQSLPAGTFITIVEVILEFWSAVLLCQKLAPSHRYLALIPIGFGVGDLFYGLSNYTLKLQFANQLASLTYVIPYLASQIFGTLAAATLLKRMKYRGSLILVILVSLTLILINSRLIIIPALFHKEPALSYLMKGLTVLFTISESIGLALSAVLLLVTVSPLIQLALFGITLTYVSDMAIRYQSVDMSLMGMSFFENSWCVGVALLTTASLLLAPAKASKLSHRDGRFHLEKEMDRHLPLGSIRGIAIGFLFFGLVLFWLLLAGFLKYSGNASYMSATLLILVIAFSISIACANVITARLSELTLSLESTGEIRLKHSKWGLPKEIEVISNEFFHIHQNLRQERDHAQSLSTKLAHDVRSPIAAIHAVTSTLRKLSTQYPHISDDLESSMELLEIATNVTRSLADDILNERKRALGIENVEQSVRSAVQLVSGAKQRNPIRLEAIAGDLGDLRSPPDLTRVLTNLITNAAEASDEGAEVKVLLNRGTNTCRVVVLDRGGGIPRTLLNRLRKGEQITSKKDGNGIGLSSAVSWANSHGVRLSIDSSSEHHDRGTRITLEIPT